MGTYAIIPAAGSGRRFGGQKQFQLLGGKPLFLYATETFLSSPLIAGICLTVPEDDISSVKALTKGISNKEILVVAGGRERQDSVRNGLEALPACDIVVVHDGVRPLVTKEVIERTIKGVTDSAEFGGCAAGLPVKETTKRVDSDGIVRDTIDRSELWSVQTPQTFWRDVFQRAVRKSEEDHFLGTDEAMLVERIGERVRMVLGTPYNIKITTPEDLKIAEAFLKLR